MEQGQKKESATYSYRCCSWWTIVFKVIILACVIIFTFANVYYYFFFIREQQDYNRAESKRYECKQDVQGIITQYNSVASQFDPQNQEDQQSLANFALNLGLIDKTGNPIDNKTLIEKCIKGEL